MSYYVPGWRPRILVILGVVENRLVHVKQIFTHTLILPKEDQRYLFRKSILIIRCETLSTVII